MLGIESFQKSIDTKPDIGTLVLILAFLKVLILQLLICSNFQNKKTVKLREFFYGKQLNIGSNEKENVYLLEILRTKQLTR